MKRTLLKRLLALLTLAAFLPFQAAAAYAYVTGYDWYDTNSNTTVALPSVVYANGETVFLTCTYGSGTRIVESFGDGGTNTYTYIGTASDAGDGQSTAIFVVKNAVAGTYTVTLTLASAATYKGLGIRRYTGLDNAGTAQFISNVQGSVATSADAITSTNITPNAQPAILFAFTMETSGSGSAPSAGTGFNSRGAFANWDSFISLTMSEDKRLTTLTAAPGTFTASTSSNTYTTIGVVYPEPGASGGGGGAPPSGLLMKGAGK